MTSLIAHSVLKKVEKSGVPKLLVATTYQEGVVWTGANVMRVFIAAATSDSNCTF